MGEIVSIENENATQQTTKKNKFLSFFSKLVREALAILCWGYGITKLFLFDIDIF